MVAIGCVTFLKGTSTGCGRVFQRTGLQFDRGPRFLRTTTKDSHDHESRNGAHDECDKYKALAVAMMRRSERRCGRALKRSGRRCDRDRLIVSLNARVRSFVSHVGDVLFVNLANLFCVEIVRNLQMRRVVLRRLTDSRYTHHTSLNSYPDLVVELDKTSCKRHLQVRTKKNKKETSVSNAAQAKKKSPSGTR
jgi:hypothetical protein